MRITFDHGIPEFSDLGMSISGSRDLGISGARGRPILHPHYVRMSDGASSKANDRALPSRAWIMEDMVGWERGPIRVLPGYTTPGTPTRPHRTATPAVPHDGYVVVLWALKRECVTLKYLLKSI